jgi:hypothetical protein
MSEKSGHKKRAVMTPLPTMHTVGGDVPARSGAFQDGRTVGRSSGRNYKFNTNVRKATHNSMKVEAARTGKAVGALIEEAWELWLAKNKSK